MGNATADFAGVQFAGLFVNSSIEDNIIQNGTGFGIEIDPGLICPAVPSQGATFTNGSANIVLATTAIAVGCPLIFTTTGTLPSGFSTSTQYYVLTLSSLTVTVGPLPNGPQAVAITAGSAGTGSQSSASGTVANPGTKTGGNCGPIVLKNNWVNHAGTDNIMVQTTSSTASNCVSIQMYGNTTENMANGSGHSNIHLKAAGAPDRPGIGQRRTTCYYLERIAGRGCSDTDETMLGNSENHVAVQAAKSRYATTMRSRLQRDRTSGATDLTTCASSTSFKCDRPARTGVLGAGATGARRKLNSTAIPGVWIVNAPIPTSASSNHKSRWGIVAVGRSVRTNYLD